MTSYEQVAISLWHPEIERLRLPPLTDELVVDAEGQLGVRLPPDLIHLLRTQNGGVIADAWDAFPTDASVYADDHVPFDHLYGIGPADQAGTTTLLDTPYLVREWELPSPVVLLSGQGHYWIALDYRECGPAGTPSVVWLDNEMDQELQLAPDIRAFVERLTASDSFPE
ncbi:SMI1/KNR4 family protein [Actinoplanes sp. NEAU-A12]|uniref:SMI1/KNR4 family protein n=1 Tax=Actinoplanes sandaracinus TaxID=3045177 RepID=A0ABT6X0X2_9ACTN|nr:SMI1/KNR4 family protein [Actinoplanes sandaracinus]MDI6105656.1 SMI1/KNR4 family protein [Actinoplanes sandaracinus]